MGPVSAQLPPEATAGKSAVDPSADRVLTLLRDVVTIVREAIGHPMTWLVVALFVIGGIAVKRFDRRPK